MHSKFHLLLPVLLLSCSLYGRNAHPNDAAFSISGHIQRANGTSVSGVKISLTGTVQAETFTDAAGNYSFSGISEGSNITLKVTKTDQLMQCVTVRDAMQSRVYQYGIDTISSGYQFLAGDVDQSGSITVYDWLQTVLAVTNAAPATPESLGWEFIPADIPVQPGSIAIVPEVIFNNLQADQVKDFIAVKMGDITDCTDDTHQPAYMSMTFNNITGNVGSTVDVTVRVNQFTNVAGLQFSMNWNPQNFQFISVDPIYTKINVVPWANIIEAEAGKISFCTFNPDLSGQTISNGSVLFKMKFNILGPTTGAPAFGFADSPTPAEMVDGNLIPYGINFINGEATTATLCDNCIGASADPAVLISPNPASGSTLLTFNQPAGENWQTTLSDITGKIWSVTPVPVEADHQTIDLSGIPAGVYFLKVEEAQHLAIHVAKIVTF